jgi:hypothetical protein
MRGAPASLASLAERLAPWLALALLAAGAALRLEGVPVIHRDDPLGLLRSDPALLYYISSRVVEHGGGFPDDFRADPRIEWPEPTDIPASFTLGQELLLAWTYLAARELGSELPLHRFAHVAMSLVASLTLLAVMGLARELGGSRAWACLAGLLFLCTPATYRTLGMILVREDLSLPLFALHLYLLVRAMRVRTAAATLLAALAAAAALATWHAMTFVFAVEVACLFAWQLRTGENPTGPGEAGAARGALFLGVIAAAGLLVPVMRGKALALSPPVLALAAMLAGAAIARRSGVAGLARAAATLAAFAAAALAGAALSRWLAPGAASDYAHVVEMMIAKVRYLGALPEDPLELSYDARLLWQGIFATGSPRFLLVHLGALAVLVPVAAGLSAGAWWKGRGDARPALVAAFGAAALLLALLVSRLVSLAAIPAAALAVVALRRIADARWRAPAIACVAIAQCAAFPLVMRQYTGASWYNPKLMRQLADTLHHMRDALQGDGAVAADFVTSSAVLAHTRHPVVLQPKYEMARSRARIARFTLGLYHETPEAFHELLRRDFDARYLLVDKTFLWDIRYEAGLRAAARTPPPDSAAFRLLHNDPVVYGSVPGYRLLYRSVNPVSRYRLYELVDD